MALFLFLQQGVSETRFQIKEGLTIGRSDADIKVDDPTVSSRHAQFKKDEKNGWTLVDLGSRNGIVFDGRRVRAIKIIDGVKFMIGRAYFKTKEVEDTPLSTPPDEPSENLEDTATVPPPPPGWREKILTVAQRIAKGSVNAPKTLQSFSPAVKLRFVRGLQYQVEWLVGYGPRIFGSETPDFPLLEPDAPPKTFSLTPTAEGVLFTSFDTQKVLLNGQPVKSEILKSGDEIEVLATKIIFELGSQ